MLPENIKKTTTILMMVTSMTPSHTLDAIKITTTSSSAIAERPRCRVGQFWPNMEDDILQTI